ncbi:hypothetical protein OCS65_01770 [Rhodococcus aetherivorans]|uniref:Uncharacterized protein n=1 Tax=Rhodococcus aetherivorans TaxID=191292 RepID=A0AA46P4X9_9NOCA|nr:MULTISPECIES: hypothetical protein [Rhodococcus]QIX52907.1 hypothetical protein HFP48_27505 [Rhodococcus sp. DMU1]UGQ41420.1 hypothetical protein LRQ66_25505 [Rhodococcus aetherivorans]UYF94530.1 hypothetical protein OCS65_01770 [Rhodococcus aetherivorans]
MNIASHLDKFERLCDLRDRLHPLEDFELWYWTTLTAGTNAYNASLHDAGLTRDDRLFSTIPGVHVAPQPDGTYRRILCGLGDVSHVGWPSVPRPIPPDIEALEHALETIEHHRDPCLRGYHTPDRHIVDECEHAFSQVRATLTTRTRG